MDSQNTIPTVVGFGDDLLDRIVQAHQRVQEREDRAVAALVQAAVPFALGGSNATAVWIATVDEGAVRGVRNVELVISRSDLNIASESLQTVGFVSSKKADQLRFLDGADGKWRSALEITFAGESVQGKSPGYKAPGVDDSLSIRGHRVLSLKSLVAFQLARYRLDDVVDLRDMIGVGLIDDSWPKKFIPELAARLQELLDDPDG